jgi:hypothetical protein
VHRYNDCIAFCRLVLSLYNMYFALLFMEKPRAPRVWLVGDFTRYTYAVALSGAGNDA